MYPTVLAQAGSSPTRQPKYTPITTLSWFSGLVTQRSPFSPYSSRSEARYLGGRPDMLIGGLNVELSNIGTLQRRPGLSVFSSANLGGPALTFYAFHPPSNSNNPITIIADTATNVYTLTTSSKTSILTKANGSGQTYFQGVGNTLYMGDGIDLQAWQGTGATRNWGIGMNNTASTVGPNGCGTGTDVSVPGTVWINPGNITANDGNFATVTLPPPSAGSSTAGPNSPGTAGTSGAGRVWSNPNNIKVKDGSSATVILFGANLTSNELQASNYSFGIPSNATITGITVTITKAGSVVGDMFDNDVTLLKAGVAVGTPKTDPNSWPTVLTDVSYGNSADLWGTTWTPSDINNSGFGVQISAIYSSSGSTASVDYISITISYNVPVGASTVTDLLEGTNFGFALSSANTVSGVLV
jgi:hypothetical protein